jgi:uncharacterized membrane protein
MKQTAEQEEPGAQELWEWVPWKRVREAAPGLVMIFMGVFAWVWAIARAQVQSMTGDEAESYELYVAGGRHWTPAANNHLLNSFLESATTSVFGLSNLSVRAPALLGAAIYIVVAFCLARLVSRDWRVRIPLFAWLVFNPFIFDFFVAARGYGMATAFLMMAIALPMWCHQGWIEGRRRPVTMVCALSSLALALAFAANFAFAFAIGAAGLALLGWAMFLAPAACPAAQRPSRTRLVVAVALPALAVILLLPSWTLLHWPPGQFFDGAHSLRETIRTVIEASIFQPNANLLNPLLLPKVERIKGRLIPYTCLVALVQFILVLVLGRKTGDRRRAWLAGTAAALAGIVAVALLAHWAAFRLFGLLLPWHRTAIWIVPPVTLLIGIAAALPATSHIAAAGHRAVLVMMFVTAVYFLFCLRLTYFREWEYQRDLKKVYDVVACYNHNKGVRDVEIGWWYHAGMNYYRLLSGRENFRPFTSHLQHTGGGPLYVLNGAFESDFIEAEKLRIVYHGEASDVVVAVRPEIADAAEGACYVPPPL